MNNQSEKPRVVIIGAGFGGLWAAKKLHKQPVEVLLLDRNNYHSFWPLLYQVGSAELEPSQIAYPVRAILRRQPNVRFVMAEVTAVDTQQQLVQTADPHQPPLAYDYLILASGSVARFFGIPGAERHTFPLKTMEDGIRLRNQILRCFETAEREQDPQRRRRLLTFAIVGGGPTGIEYAGALAELVYNPLAKDYPGITINEVQIILVEAQGQLLQGMPDSLGQYAAARLQTMGVEVRLQAMVSAITADSLTLNQNEPIPTETVIWTAGVGGEEVAARSGLPTQRNGTVPVQPTLQVDGLPQVYVVGDLAYFEEKGQSLPMLAPVAMQQGEWAARNILRHLNGEAPQPFSYRDRGSMATIGRNAAVARLYGRNFTGFIAWLVWVFVHIQELIGFRNRLVVLINWAYNYIAFERMVRLILPAKLTRDKQD
ncbi:MAG: NAD(P)/FAD-dependent oxidoreductase [Chloroflexota bacterium]